MMTGITKTDNIFVYKIILIFFIILSTFIDIISTFFPRNFMVGEVNPLVLIGMHINFLFFAKLFIMCYFAYWVWNARTMHGQQHPLLLYFFFVGMMIFILLQTYAGWNNYNQKKYVMDDIMERHNVTFDKMSDIPQEYIMPYVMMDKQQARNIYYSTVFTLGLYPMIVSMLSFIFYNLLVRGKMD